MTRPKLRACVGVVSSSAGIIFRLRDNFLEIKGKDCCRWFSRIQPLLAGDVTMSQARTVLDTRAYSLFTRIIDKLQEAQMVYDAVEDERHMLADDAMRQQSPFLVRIEAHSTRPLRDLAKARQLRILVAGELRRIIPLVEACSEAGILPYAIYASDEDAYNTAHVLGGLLQESFSQSEPRPCMLSQSDFYDQLVTEKRVNAFLLTGSEEHDTELMTRISSLTVDAAPFVLRLSVFAESAIAAILPSGAGMGCPMCLAKYYGQQNGAALGAAELDAEIGIRIAARLLVQDLLDLETGIDPLPGASQLKEVDLQTSEIRRRPLFPHPDCSRCLSVSPFSDREWPLNDLAFAERDLKQLSKNAERSCIDPRTGLVAEVSEGTLLQFPYHQSAVRRYSFLSPAPQNWLTEAGDNLSQARTAVLHRALESYLQERLLGLDLYQSPPSYALGISHEQARKCDALMPGVVTSAASTEELLAHGFLQALAQYAHRMSMEWAEVEVSAQNSEIGDDLVLGYFDDMKLLPRLRVQRNVLMGQNGIEVFRFAHGSAMVSVVAGVEVHSALRIGLRDLWLDITGADAFGPTWNASRVTRFRSCSSTRTTSSWIREFIDRLGLELQLRLLTPPLTVGVPALFTHSVLVQRTEAAYPHSIERMMSRASHT